MMLDVRREIHSSSGNLKKVIRAASLAKLTVVKEAVPDVEKATSKWIRENLPSQSDENALWVLEHQFGIEHVEWWLRAVRKGLANSFADMTTDWVKAIWRWWTIKPETVVWTQSLMPAESATENALLSNLPQKIAVELLTRMKTLCSKLNWVKLLAGILRISQPLNEAVRVLRDTVSDPELGLDVLLGHSRPEEIVLVAAVSGWEPLIKRAAQKTLGDPALFSQVNIMAAGFLPLLAIHLSAGGNLPSEFNVSGFAFHLFDRCIIHDEHCFTIILHLGNSLSDEALMYPRQDELWNALGPSRQEPLLSTTGLAWLKRFVAGEHLERPGSALAAVIRSQARTSFRGGSIGRIIDFITIFPEVSEQEFVDWLSAETFLWGEYDQERLGEILINRKWSVAAKRFKWSTKRELNAVAWYARELLSFWERAWFMYPTLEGSSLKAPNYGTEKRSEKIMKILFLAANPLDSGRLSLDEEARSIEEKIRAANFREEVVFCTKWAVRPNDLQQALLEEKPTIVHFSGHGGGKAGIALHSEAHGSGRLIGSEALADLFKILKDNLRVVVLNACHSREQAIAIVKEIDFVIGMADSIGDEAARNFAAAFYRGLAFGRTVQASFDLGINELKLMGLKQDYVVPLLLVRAGLDAASVCLIGVTF